MAFKVSKVRFDLKEEELSDLTEETMPEFAEKLQKLFDRTGIKVNHYEGVTPGGYWLTYGEDLVLVSLPLVTKTSFHLDFMCPHSPYLYVDFDRRTRDIKFKFIGDDTLYLGLRNLDQVARRLGVSPTGRTESHNLYVVTSKPEEAKNDAELEARCV